MTLGCSDACIEVQYDFHAINLGCLNRLSFEVGRVHIFHWQIWKAHCTSDLYF